MATRDLAGIEGFFDDLNRDEAPEEQRSASRLTSEAKEQTADERKRRQSEKGTAQHPQKTAKQQGSAADTETRTEPVPLPTGRPPGRKDGEGPRRTKASLYIDADLMDEYRERVYVERRHLGELVEQALRAYKQQNW